MKRAIAYIRCSSESQAESGLGLDAQEGRIREWCAAHGYSLAAIHTDAGITGTIRKRPGLQAALAAVGKGEILIVYSLSRFARNTLDALTLLNEVNRRGADFVSLTEQWDTTTPMGKAMFGITAIFAQLERDLLAQRTKEALAVKIGRRERVGAVPFGYQLAPDGIQLIADDAEQATIETIHALRRSMGLRQIAATLDARGIRPKKGGAKWCPSAVRRILKRQAYARP